MIKYLPPSWSEWSDCNVPLSEGDKYPHPNENFPVANAVFSSGLFIMAMMEKIVTRTSDGVTIGRWCSFNGDSGDVFTKVFSYYAVQ